MKIDVREISENYIKFVVEDSSTAILNPIRRILIGELPKMAIEDVEFHLGPIRDETGKEFESVTPLFDEIIAHRLGLIPIPTDLKLFGFRDKCVCKGEGCPNCTIMYTLNKKGPCTVYSKDLEPLGDAKFAIKNQGIPLVKLGEGQAILIYATAILGRGFEHAKWQTVAGTTIRYYPTVNIDHDICDNGGGCIDTCPKNIMKKDNDKVIVGENSEDCILCDSCVEICVPRQDANMQKAISVHHDESKLICSFETDDSMTAIDVLKESIAIFTNKLKTFSEHFETVVDGPLWEEIEEEEEEEEEVVVVEGEEALPEEVGEEPVEIITKAIGPGEGEEPLPSPDEISIFPDDIEPEVKEEEPKEEEPKEEEPKEEEPKEEEPKEEEPKEEEPKEEEPKEEEPKEEEPKEEEPKEEEPKEEEPKEEGEEDSMETDEPEETTEEAEGETGSETKDEDESSE